MKYQSIINPIDPKILRAELREHLLLRRTNKDNNEIYTFRAVEAPNLMLELGRLREEAFRFYGGGTGKSADIDQFDLDPNGYKQLIVWNPDTSEIVGGYRYILGQDVRVDGTETNLSSNEIFEYTPTFLNEYLPKCIELGRSFVRVDYQQAGLAPRSIFALDNLWDGLGALILIYDEYEYFFGKVTMYRDYNKIARDLIIYYLQTHYKGIDDLMNPLYPIPYTTELTQLQNTILGVDQQADLKSLNSAVRAQGVNIPPLVNAYMNLSSSLQVFGTSSNPEFGGVEETAIMIPFMDINESKRHRHIVSFLRDAGKRFRPNILNKISKRMQAFIPQNKF